MVKQTDSNSFETDVLQNDKITVVDFYADWCGPCRKLGPIIEEIESEFSERVNFVKINTDNNIEIARNYGISGLPTLLVFKNGEVAERIVGFVPKNSLINSIEKHL